MSSPAETMKAQLYALVASGLPEDEAINTMLGVALIAKVKLGMGEAVKAVIDQNEAHLMKTLPTMLDPAMKAARSRFQ